MISLNLYTVVNEMLFGCDFVIFAFRCKF